MTKSVYLVIRVDVESDNETSLKNAHHRVYRQVDVSLSMCREGDVKIIDREVLECCDKMPHE